MKTAIITGITGQDGAYLAELLLANGYRVLGLTRGYNNESLKNLAYLGIVDKVVIEECDLLDISSIMRNISKYQPNEIYNLAAQSSVGLSFSQPIGTISFNTMSVLNLLEAIRTVKPDIKFYQASSSEMYGRVNNLPITEESVLHPLSPYAISKASSHWTVVNYRESYNLFACCGIFFNHESFLRSKDFFIKKVILGALKISRKQQDVLRVGNIDIKRDFGFSPKYVEAMYLMLQQDTAQDFLICSGESLSLREIIYYIFDKLGIDRNKLVVDPALYRPNEIQNIYGDNQKAKKILNWNYDMNFFNVLDILIDEEEKNLI
jgi:GDPmannose 4,6-dehydratase